MVMISTKEQYIEHFENTVSDDDLHKKFVHILAIKPTERSWNSVVITATRLWAQFTARQKIFLFSKSSKPAPGTAQSYSMGTGRDFSKG
jgi:hypothetical protein